MELVKVWDKKIKGRLYAVGDIHGCYSLLMARLNQIGFNFDNDLLVAVGDLVDRGTQKPCRRDNCYWIDTGAVHWGTMTILDLANL